MCSIVMKFTIICIYVIDGGLSHEEWSRQSGGSGSSPAGINGLSTEKIIAIAIAVAGAIAAITIITIITTVFAPIWCCKRNKAKTARGTTDEDHCQHSSKRVPLHGVYPYASPYCNRGDYWGSMMRCAICEICCHVDISE